MTTLTTSEHIEVLRDAYWRVRSSLAHLARSQPLRLTTERRAGARDRNAFELGKDAQRLGLLELDR